MLLGYGEQLYYFNFLTAWIEHGDTLNLKESPVDVKDEGGDKQHMNLLLLLMLIISYLLMVTIKGLPPNKYCYT